MQQPRQRKKRTVKPTDYSDKKFTRCWTCQNATGGCSWSHLGEPVKGWTEKETYLPANGPYAHGYFVISCPEYVEDLKK